MQQSLVHLDVNISSCANIETAVNTIGSTIGNASDYVGHAHDWNYWSTGVTDSNNPHVPTWET
jgi:hypothetical protein